MKKQGIKACESGCVKEHRLQASEDSVPDLDQVAGCGAKSPGSRVGQSCVLILPQLCGTLNRFNHQCSQFKNGDLWGRQGHT